MGMIKDNREHRLDDFESLKRNEVSVNFYHELEDENSLAVFHRLGCKSAIGGLMSEIKRNELGGSCLKTSYQLSISAL